MLCVSTYVRGFFAVVSATKVTDKQTILDKQRSDLPRYRWQIQWIRIKKSTILYAQRWKKLNIKDVLQYISTVQA